MSWTRAWSDAVVSFFFPVYCVGCGKRLDGSTHCLVCSQCFDELPKYQGMEPYYKALDRLSGFLPFTEFQSDLIFTNPGLVRKLLHLFKYQGYPMLGYHLTSQFVAHHKSQGHFSDVSMIVPVPLLKSRLRKRGYNQSLYIAKAFAEVYQLPIEEGVLIRNKMGQGTQTKRSKEERWVAMADAFSLASGKDVSGKRILLVDDLLTTGATLIQAGRVLIDHGAESVSFYTLALDTLL